MHLFVNLSSYYCLIEENFIIYCNIYICTGKILKLNFVNSLIINYYISRGPTPHSFTLIILMERQLLFI